MGQYHFLTNIDKQITVDHNFDLIGGMKLMEHSYVGNPLAVYLRKQLNKNWRGDRVLQIGDYCGIEDGTTTQDIIKSLVDRGELKVAENNDKSVELPKQLVKIPKTYEKTDRRNYRYVANIDKKEYIDLERAIPDYIYADVTEGSKVGEIGCRCVDPVLLLIDCGNDQGGGDYHDGCINYDKVGYWAGDHLFSTNKTSELDGYKLVDYYFEDNTDWNDDLNKYLENMVGQMQVWKTQPDGRYSQCSDSEAKNVKFVLDAPEAYKDIIKDILKKKKYKILVEEE